MQTDCSMRQRVACYGYSLTLELLEQVIHLEILDFFGGRGCTHSKWRFPASGLNPSHSCRPTPQPQQQGIRAMSVTYTTAHGTPHTGSLTHWTRPGIKPTISWFLVRFVNYWATMGTPLSLFLSFVFLGPHSKHMKGLRLGPNRSNSHWPTPQLTAMLDLNPLSGARDQTQVLVDASQIRFRWARMGTPLTDPFLLSIS